LLCLAPKPAALTLPPPAFAEGRGNAEAVARNPQFIVTHAHP
jgi:hypothetical protein